MQCTTAKTYRSDTTDVYGDYQEERLALGFDYFPNFTKERQLLQDKLITTYLAGIGAGVKRCTFMMGTPGSGKSTEAARIGAFVIDADRFKERLPEFHKWPRHLASGVVHREAALLAAITQRRAEKIDATIVIDSAAANQTWLEGEIRRLRGLGYHVELVRVYLDKSKCRARCQARNRHVPTFVIDQIYDQVNATFLKVFKQFDKVRVVHT